MSKNFAPGLPSKKNKDAIPRLSSPIITQMVIQQHSANIAGNHYDLRLNIGGKAISWALKNLPKYPGDKTLAIRQPDHTVPYMHWEGTIEKGYGAGTVKLFDQDKIEITKSDLDHITFNRYLSNGDTERYALIPTGGDQYLFANTTPTRATRPEIPSAKPSYKSVDIHSLDVNNPNEIFSPKIDGSLNAFLLRKDKPIEVYSYRPSVKSKIKLIDHTYRFPYYKDKVSKAFKGKSVVLGEAFARDREGNVLPNTDTSARLLSNVWRSRELQKNAPLDNIIYNVLRYQGRDVSTKPYSEKLQILKRITASIPNLKMPPLAETPEQKTELLNQIVSGKHPLTREGIVIYDKRLSTPIKAKITEDYDVHIKGVFPGEGKYKGIGAGGFIYSHTPEGPVIGRVGSGFSDEQRVDMLVHPEKYKGQVARVFAQQKLPSGALRVPIFKDLRPEMWKKASNFERNFLHSALRAAKRAKVVLSKDAWRDLSIQIAQGGGKYIKQTTEPAIYEYEVIHEGKPLRVAYNRNDKVIKTVLATPEPPIKFKVLGKMDLNKKASITLTDYQKELKQRMQNQHGLVVGWGLGSGKSIGSIAAMDQFGPTTAVVPASLRENFKKELRTYKPENKFSTESYEKFVKHPDTVAGKNIIFDEAHRLKTTESKRSQLAQHLAAQTRKILLLTGTPIQNKPHEIAPLVNVAAGHPILPVSEKDFNAHYVKRVVDKPGIIRRIFGAKPKDELHAKNIEDFKQRVSPYYMNYSNPIDKSMPKRINKQVDVEMSPMQTRVYHVLEKQLPGHIKRTIENKLPADKRDLSRLNAFLSATRQVSNTNEKFYTRGEKKYSPKLEAIAKNVAHGPGRSLVYSNYLDAGVQPISELLAKRKVPYGVYTGKLNDKERKRLVSSYNKGKIKSLIISSSGGEGLDLKGTRQVHITEPHWNDAKIEQVVGRSIRKGSHTMLAPKNRTVEVYRYQSLLPKKRGGFLWLKKKRPVSADQYLENISNRKKQLNSEFMDVLNKKAFDVNTNNMPTDEMARLPAIMETDVSPMASADPHAYKTLLMKAKQTLTKKKNNPIIEK